MDSRTTLISATAASLCFILCICMTNGQLQRFIEPAQSDGSVSFITIGDWGRRGDYNQSVVAYQVWNILIIYHN